MKTIKPLILAIDTSCDDTSVAILRGPVVLSNVIASQVELHKEFGGVFPTVAKQAHRENIEPSIKLALRRAGVSAGELAAVAVTTGPGLAPALEVGVAFAKDLSRKLKIPLLAVNHVEGHLLSPLVERQKRQHSEKIVAKPVKYPVLGLVISGGHTDFILVTGVGEYQRLGFSIDDAAGECLDKIGRMLGLGYPAGALIEQFAVKGNAKRFEFPLPMTQVKDFNLSFSGLKTFARNLIAGLESENKLDRQAIFDLCASAQAGVFRHVLYKLDKILDAYPVKELWLGGGVAANVYLRKLLRFRANQKGLQFRIPFSKRLCSDNAAMIGLVGGQKFLRQEWVKNLEIVERRPNWQIGEE